jgi:hypothetical protein
MNSDVTGMLADFHKVLAVLPPPARLQQVSLEYVNYHLKTAKHSVFFYFIVYTLVCLVICVLSFFVFFLCSNINSVSRKAR